jgi:ABC-type dipeptide/oligopeptide/nickel transport system permease subunit
MFEVLLHTGTEHSNLTMTVLSSVLAFFVGIGIGTYSGTLRKFVRTVTAE